MAGSNKIPIRLGDFSIVDSEFDNIRERFDSEMKKMEEEMNKFRNELLHNESKVFSKSARSSSSTYSSTSKTKESSEKFVDGKRVFNDSMSSSSSTEKSSDVLSDSGLGNHSNWLQGLDSPLIKSSEASSGQKELKLRFDVSQYQPEEIMVKTVDNKLLVHAKHEEKGDGKSVYREYNREFLLPSGTDPESIRSSLSKDGVLTVEAPLPHPALTQEH